MDLKGTDHVKLQFYDQTLEHALHQLGVSNQGFPLYDNWQLDIGSLRSWLRKLRQVRSMLAVKVGCFMIFITTIGVYSSPSWCSR